MDPRIVCRDRKLKTETVKGVSKYFLFLLVNAFNSFAFDVLLAAKGNVMGVQLQ